MFRIISIVLNIFNYIFEQDVRRRKRMRSQFEAEKKQLAKKPESGQLDRYAEKLEAWLTEVMSQDEKRSSQVLKRIRHDVPPVPREPKYETVREHLEETRFRNASVGRHVRDHLGHQTKRPKSRKSQDIELPGDDTLEKLMYAQVIMGPCKAHQRMGFKRKLQL
jgi:plasmid stabilization system protein ParE